MQGQFKMGFGGTLEIKVRKKKQRASETLRGIAIKCSISTL